jgi:FeS assembly SUF system regulator
MIRISRLTDYGIVLMTHMAAHAERVHNATEVAAEAHLPAPTVSKLLRQLAKEGLLESHRGVKGGYGLARRAEEITVGHIIKALEGPVSITTCTNDSPGECEHEPLCPVRSHWYLINLAVRQALDSVTLADMVAHPRRIQLPTVGRAPVAACAPPLRTERRQGDRPS